MEQKQQTSLPNCNNWKLWSGKEIEGYTDIGVYTLFVRNASIEEIERNNSYERIWICSEHEDLSDYFIDFLESLNRKIIFDFTYEKYQLLKQHGSLYKIDKHQIYLRIDSLDLKFGDHVKIGKLFNEESFLIGSGKKVQESDYYEDINLL